MNDAIKKITVDTDIWCDQHWSGHHMYNVMWEQKFAELVVRACAALVDRELASGGCDGRAVLDYFGVDV